MQRCAEGHKAYKNLQESYKNIQESVLCLFLTGCPPDVHVGQRMRAGVLYITVAQGLRPNLPSLETISLPASVGTHLLQPGHRLSLHK